MGNFINMDPLLAYGLSVWRPVAESETVLMGNGLPFLRNKARQYGVIDRAEAGRLHGAQSQDGSAP